MSECINDLLLKLLGYFFDTPTAFRRRSVKKEVYGNFTRTILFNSSMKVFRSDSVILLVLTRS